MQTRNNNSQMAGDESQPPPRVALVIGAGSAIGHAISRSLMADGFQTFIAGPDLAIAKRDCENYNLARALYIDITKPNELEDALDKVNPGHGIDVVVSCAAYSTFSPLRRKEYHKWHRMVEIGLTGHLNLLGACGGLHIHPKHLIFISSLNARLAIPGYAAYCAAKAGLEALVRVAALEFAPDTVVNAVAPGPVNTPGRLANALPAMLDATKKRHLIEPRLAEPREVADVVSFLVGPRCGWMTGQVLTVDGGCGINYGHLLDPQKLDEFFEGGGAEYAE